MTNYPTVIFLQRSFFMHIREVEGDLPNTVNPSVVRTRRYLTGASSKRRRDIAGCFEIQNDSGLPQGNRASVVVN
jgi:hypothetical protein